MQEALDRILYLEAALEALAMMKPHERDVVLLRLDGLTYREIGARLGISRPAAGMRMVRARRRLREELKAIERDETQ
jgi:RNA polymerase sigma factor (sigma-70 family)